MHAAARGDRRHATWLEGECLETGGAFKLRGASHRLLHLTESERARSGRIFLGQSRARSRVGRAPVRHRGEIVMPADARR